MEILIDVKGASVYRKNPVPLKWYKEEGKLLKQGKSWVWEYNVVFRDVNRYEVYTLIHKGENKSPTHWLVENNILQGTGKVGSGTCKVECIPQYPVELIKEAPDNRENCIVKRKDWPC